MSSFQQFQEQVIQRVALSANNRNVNYAQYLSEIPEASRTGDEANAVDQQFSRYVLEWLGFGAGDWTYNQPVEGHKSDKPDYVVRALVGVAFIWENKNSTLSLEDKHLQQMRRYATGTGGYAVWCNMRRILAVRFSAGDGAGYEIITDVDVEKLYGAQPALPDEQEAQAQNLDLLRLLFGKERYTQFAELVERIARSEADFLESARTLSEPNALRQFISDSRQSLDHLRLAALAQIRDAISRDAVADAEETNLRAEWGAAQTDFVAGVGHNGGAVKNALDKLLPGETDRAALQGIEAVTATARGLTTLPATLRVHFDRWLERTERTNAALRAIRFTRRNTLRVAEAYRTWVSNQRDEKDAKPETFAEQVAYVFFVRLLLVRVLEDKKVLATRIASDGGFAGWVGYLNQHFGELDGISILNESYCGLLTRKAGSFYLHFFQQPVFDWFIPDDYLLVETLEFLSRYNFQSVASDIIGFTYEEYIDRNARNRKGHFLTRPEVVEYMLDLLGYNTPDIFGQRILDPACGSGSFLVHAARRYRDQLVTALCRREGLPLNEESLTGRPELRSELARSFINGLTENFHGMEINPFSCYLAEMNLLIQALDDLAYLQRNTDETFSIERFRIFNTNSLDLPYDLLNFTGLTVQGGNPPPITDYLSDRILDEAFPVKARFDDFAAGFGFIIFNPPYVSGRREDTNRIDRLRRSDFFSVALGGETNLYLMFVRLCLYYLADYGKTVFIIPLTILGDPSSSAARRILKARPFYPSAVTRFYRGDILFPGVDQAVAIIAVQKMVESARLTVAGGLTIDEARSNTFDIEPGSVLGAVPDNGAWNGAWLVTSDPESSQVWLRAKAVSDNLTRSLRSLLAITFDIRQGDVNASHLNPLRLGAGGGALAQGNVAIYKGEQMQAWGSLPTSPADWATTQTLSTVAQTISAAASLRRITQITGSEVGMVIRQVARLNTRDRITATWFERDATTPYAFTNELWRLVLRPDGNVTTAKALLCYVNSRVAAFLVNLFSTNNHVGSEELNRIPIPNTSAFPEAELARLAEELLTTRAALDTLARKYTMALPETEDAEAALYLPPAAVLATDVGRRKTKIADLVLRGVLQNTGANTAKLQSLNRNNRITITAPTGADPDAVTETLGLFLSAPALQNKPWAQVQSEPLPEPVVAADFLAHYRGETETARALWRQFRALQNDVDRVVCDWYNFNETERAVIAAGLPWARRRTATPNPLPAAAPYTPQTEREPVTSSLISAIGYDAAQALLEVELVSGEIYGYAPVPPELYEAFREAASKGAFYNENIKSIISRYPSE